MAAPSNKRPKRAPAPASAGIPGIVAPLASPAPVLPDPETVVEQALHVPAALARPVRKAPVRKAKPVEAESPAIDSPAPAPATIPEIVQQAEPARAVAVEAAADVAGTTSASAESLAETAQDAVETLQTQAAETAEQVTGSAEATVAHIAETTTTAAQAVHAKQEQTIMDTIQNSAEKTQAMFADANDRAKGAMEKGAKFFQELTEFGKGNVEAVVESSKIAAKGFETLGQDAAAYWKSSFEDATQAMRTLAAIKSPTELMKFQADYVRSSFDAMVAQASRGTEASLKLAGEVAQPISNRVAVAAEKMKVVA
ncbi:hypothetical protein GCM10011380_30450 [Sphingomonas metalli]|uniref:Phasin domain-containing protein n=1 Tax=Sphingomonas metalli TaxID=1779358 RepID=A0A916TBT3_9SPHN|nr:phasin family protein [Sphingomonas metalli]GGB38912.1 hypothetical protein GCM10011380_30450 [Sphingomonas metalli]